MGGGGASCTPFSLSKSSGVEDGQGSSREEDDVAERVRKDKGGERERQQQAYDPVRTKGGEGLSDCSFFSEELPRMLTSKEKTKPRLQTKGE